MDMYFSQFKKLASPRLSCQQIQFLITNFSQAFSQLIYCSLMAERERERKFWSLFFFYRDTNSIKGTPTSWLHLNLTSPQSPYFHISSHWWLGLQNVILGRHNQSIRNHLVKRTLKNITEKCITVIFQGCKATRKKWIHEALGITQSNNIYCLILGVWTQDFTDYLP